MRFGDIEVNSTRLAALRMTINLKARLWFLDIPEKLDVCIPDSVGLLKKFIRLYKSTKKYSNHLFPIRFLTSYKEKNNNSGK